MDLASSIVSKGMIFSRISNANVLSEKGKAFIEQYNSDSLRYQGKINDLMNESKTYYNKFKIDVIKLKNDIKSSNEKTIELKTKIESFKKENDLIQGIIEKDTVVHKNLKGEGEQLMNKFKIFATELESLEILNIATLPSIQSQWMTGSSHLILANYKKPENSIKDSIIVLENKVYEANRNQINNCKSIREFDDLKLSHIWKDGKSKNNDAQFKININDYINDRIKIDIGSNKEFVVICLFSQKIYNLPQSRVMVGYFDQLISNNKASVENIERTTENNRDKIKKNSEEILYCQTENKVNDQLKLELAISFKKTQKDFDSDKEHFTNLINKEYEKNKALYYDTTFNSTCDLSNILTSHGVEKHLFKKIFVIKEKIKKTMDNELIDISQVKGHVVEILTLLNNE